MFSKSQSHFYLLVHIRRPKKQGYVPKHKPLIPELTKLVFVNLTGSERADPHHMSRMSFSGSSKVRACRALAISVSLAHGLVACFRARRRARVLWLWTAFCAPSTANAATSPIATRWSPAC